MTDHTWSSPDRRTIRPFRRTLFWLSVIAMSSALAAVFALVIFALAHHAAAAGGGG